MSYLENLETAASTTSTLNGAKTYSTTGHACLDLFSVAGGMRYRSYFDQLRLFDRAYIEDPELAMKLLFYIRDIREGLGERTFFRNVLRHVAQKWPASARKNVALISEYGRFDDLLCLMGTPAQDAVVECIRTRLHSDCEALASREAGEVNAHISLLAKWMPSINASSRRTRKQAQQLAQALGLSEPDYRKLLSGLRAAISLTERKLTEGKVDKIKYESVPAGAMLKYRGAFHRRDENRLHAYLKEVNEGNKQIHVDTLFPYELIRPLVKITQLPWFRSCLAINVDSDNVYADVLETLWKSQSSEVSGQNAISVIDTSGSMYSRMGDGPVPAHISQSLGLYYAERCEGTFHGKFITFESEPHLMEIHGETLVDKLRYIQTAAWGGSTNLEAVFDLILEAAVMDGTPQSEMPATIYIISDMEFNVCMSGSDATVYEAAKAKYEAAGYQLPTVVFHNVNSWQMQAPVRAHTKGTALVSGASANSFKYKFDENTTPIDHMLRILNGPRYAAVHA